MATKQKTKRRSLTRIEGNRYRIPAREVKAKRNAEILEYLKDHSETETAREFGLSKQGVAYVAHTNNMDLSHRTSGFKSRKLKASGELGKMPDVELAEKYNVDPATVANARKALQIGKFYLPSEEDCSECRNNPYAREKCKKHYSRWLYQRNKKT